MAGSRSETTSDAQALRAALEEAVVAVRRYLFGMCGDWDQAEDLAQEALMSAWRNRARFDGRSRAQTWLFAIARNGWLDHLRRGRRRPKMNSVDDVDLVDAATPQPPQVAAQRELAEAVGRALATLPDEQREALALRESGGLTFGQIADLLAVPVATVKSRVRYGLLKLAEPLAAYESELAP